MEAKSERRCQLIRHPTTKQDDSTPNTSDRMRHESPFNGRIVAHPNFLKIQFANAFVACVPLIQGWSKTVEQPSAIEALGQGLLLPVRRRNI
eukprot:SAG11_NODE_2862_length_2897_cov_10.910214_3_plen_92_part_00